MWKKEKPKFLYASFLVILCIVVVPKGVVAAPAFPGVTEVVQPNGTVIAVRLKGDEWRNWVETVDGYSVAQNRSGYWEYVRSYDATTPVLSGVKAERRPPVNLQQNIMPAPLVRASRKVDHGPPRKALKPPPTGKFNGSVLFILAEFNNVKGTYSQSSFAKLLKKNIAYFKKASNNRVKLRVARESHGKKNNGVV